MEKNMKRYIHICVCVYNYFAMHQKLTQHCKSTVFQLKKQTGTALVVQWLKICPALQGAQVPSLVRELRSHILWGD